MDHLQLTMHIHIFGASGSGVTTLGKALADELGYPYFDADSYFWEQSDIPFSVKRNPQSRNAMLLNDLSENENWVLGGSIVSWGDEIPKLFDLAVFLLLPQDVRLERLKKREHERYGDIIHTDPERKQKYTDFITWASGYDDNTTQSSTGSGLGRTLKVHRDWAAKLNCGYFEIIGDTTVNQRIDQILQVLKTLK